MLWLGLIWVLAAGFVAFKWFGVLEWPWWTVLLPLEIAFAITAGIAGFFAVYLNKFKM
jgi:hypothetical protein